MRPLHKRTSLFLTIILMAGANYAPLIWAAEIEEIIVTAQRREENLQTVPLAVTAFSEELIRSLVILDTRDLARITPNFLANPGLGQGTANSYSMRGLYNHDTIPTFDPPVGTYVDDFFIQRQNANNIALFDVERIEVLRGPQGLLFGRNTTAGAVRMILKKPAEQLGGWIEAGIGRFDRRTLRGSIDLPLNEKFLTKFTAFWEEDDGFVSNITTGETGLHNDDNLGLRDSICSAGLTDCTPRCNRLLCRTN